jgi:hypothetical protein
MADFGIRISKEGFDVNTTPTSANIKNFQLLSTENSLLEKERSATASETNMYYGYTLTPDEDWRYYFGEIKAVSIANAGSGYAAYNYVDVAGGDSNGKVGISSVNGSGAVTGLFVNMAGSGYEVASGVVTTGGAGSGFTLNITSVTDYSSVRAHPLGSNGVPIYIIFENPLP